MNMLKVHEFSYNHIYFNHYTTEHNRIPDKDNQIPHDRNIILHMQQVMAIIFVDNTKHG